MESERNEFESQREEVSLQQANRWLAGSNGREVDQELITAFQDQVQEQMYG